ncbi:arrestin domain-containing protein 2-like [Ceratina calcarata]|uniref:Arrestin domain-containing protein 2-like n=1 Tax=Ceratina calcarata TaxID=156304 RepID=A0AAJ7N5M7_9HYME|nr:arrestin domain-containing protein 2-like [Ceratina calcarata]
MPPLRSFRIIFDRPSATYLSGERVSGNIIVDVYGDKHVRGVVFCAKGEARVHWTESRSTKDSHGHNTTETVHYSNREEYFHFKYNVISTDNSRSRVTIPSGSNQYPFEFQLPYNIPSSFEHRIGQIRYTVKVVIDRPWKFDHECKAAFTVVSSLDLNEHRHNCLGIDDEAKKDFCCCCVNVGSMSVRISLPSTGFVPGQVINTRYDYENSSDSVKIEALCTKLVQKMTFHATSKSKDETSPIISTKTSGHIPDRGQYTAELRIPPIAPSNLLHCRIIDLVYQTVATVHVSGPHTRIERSYPVLIGTVPLYCPPSAPPLEDVNVAPPNPTKSENGPATMPANPPPYSSLEPTAPLPGPGPSSQNIGFVDPNRPKPNWNIPPPSYEECTSGAQHIRDDDESKYVFGADNSFAPRYPVFSYPTPNVRNN